MNWNLMTPLGSSWLSEGFTPYNSLQREINRAFDSVLGSGSQSNPLAAASWALRVDVREDDKSFHITADISGVDEKDVNVTLQDGVLTIRGEKNIERDEKNDTWHVTERSYGSFMRQISMPSNINADKVEASVKNGVLTVILPKQNETKAGSRKIEIKKA